MNHQKLMTHIINLKSKLKGDELAQLLLLKKAENFIRDLLVMEIDKDLIKKTDLYETAIREKKKHDIVILKGKMARKNIDFNSIEAIVELKYTTADWILLKRKDFVDDLTVGQDNIWRENYRYKSKSGRSKIGKESSGILRDIEKMNATDPTFKHHVLTLVSPQKCIPDKYKYLFTETYKLKSINQFLEDRTIDFIFKRSDRVLKLQLERIRRLKFQSYQFQIGSHTIKNVGKVFGVPIDIHFFIISY